MNKSYLESYLPQFSSDDLTVITADSDDIDRVNYCLWLGRMKDEVRQVSEETCPVCCKKMESVWNSESEGDIQIEIFAGFHCSTCAVPDWTPKMQVKLGKIPF